MLTAGFWTSPKALAGLQSPSLPCFLAQLFYPTPILKSGVFQLLFPPFPGQALPLGKVNHLFFLSSTWWTSFSRTITNITDEITHFAEKSGRRQNTQLSPDVSHTSPQRLQSLLRLWVCVLPAARALSPQHPWAGALSFLQCLPDLLSWHRSSSGGLHIKKAFLSSGSLSCFFWSLLSFS